MLTIRRFEERCNYLYMQGRIPSTLHLYIGQEAVATGVCAHLRRDDYLFSTHRPHGHAIAKGVSPRAIMAELFGQDAPAAARARAARCTSATSTWACSRPSPSSAATHPIAAGTALAAKRLGDGPGDGLLLWRRARPTRAPSTRR